MAFSLGTLVELLHKILHPDQHYQNWVLDKEKIPQIQSLFEKASFLRDFLADSTPAIEAEIETLEDQIRDAAENAEDVLESYLAAQILSNQSKFIFPADLTIPIRQNIPSPCYRGGQWFGKTFHLLMDLFTDENAKDILESYGESYSEAQEALDHRRQMKSFIEKLPLLRKYVAARGKRITYVNYSVVDFNTREALDHMHQMQSLLKKVSLLRKFVAESAPIQGLFQVLEDLRTVEHVKDILESYRKARNAQHFDHGRRIVIKEASLLRKFIAESARIQANFQMFEDARVAKIDILDSYSKAQALDHRRQMQSLIEKASLLKKFVAESTPIRANFEMLEDVIRGAAKNVEDILESYTKAQAIDHENIPQIQSLSGKSSFLRNFLANSGPKIRAIMDTLEDQDLTWLYNIIILSLEGIIRDGAENVQELVQTYLISTSQIFMINPPDMSEVISAFESAIAEIIKITDESGRSVSMSPAVPSRRTRDQTTNDVVVGLGKDLIELNDRLTSPSRALEIISIVGMGGIGKTTLTRKQFNEHSSSKHFDICLWATISQQYDPRHVLLSLLDCKDSDKPYEDLKVDLHKKLWSRRYLIVLDDVWSSNVWDDIRTCAPDCNNNSRIILTTRENNVADYVRSNKYEMQLLNKEDSWELFGKFAHAGEKCPSELEVIAQEIVKKCGGLPLALKVIGGVLSRVERIKHLWEKVAGDISLFIAKEDDQFSGIFSWSYANLPHYLKPCLLYIGAFPEDHEIKASRLIKVWVSEGFMNPILGKSPEETAEMYLKALLNRNLVFVRKRSFGGRVKSYGIHDLLRDLCQRKAEEKKFIFAKRLGESDDTLCPRRVCVTSTRHSTGDFSSSVELMNETRSFQIIADNTVKDFKFLKHNGFQLWRLWVLDIGRVKLDRFPEEIVRLVNLKHLALCIKSDSKSLLPLRLVLLKDLQTIIFRFWGVESQNFPMAIFLLPQLRHFKMWCIRAGQLTVVPSFTIGETLQSLGYVSVAILSQLLGKLPCLKRLGIDGCDWKGEPNIDLTSFSRLETIKIIGCYYLAPIFPQNLRELIIHASKLSGTFMSSIGSLPNLQLVRLDRCKFETETWEPFEGEFCNLQYLWLSWSDLKNWIADETHFPQLKHLVVKNCNHLKKIPLEIGGIDTLEIIEVYKCKASVFRSARRILQEQLDWANENLQLRLGQELSVRLY